MNTTLLKPRRRSQALAEFTMILPIFLTLMCGVFDYGFMIGNSQVMAMAAREGANTAARQNVDALNRSLQATVLAAQPRLRLTSGLGGVIVTRMIRNSSIDNSNLIIETPVDASVGSTGMIYGGGDNLRNNTRIKYQNTTNGTFDWRMPRRTVRFPVTNLIDGQVIFGVEVMYTNEFVTPIGTLIGLVTPPILYDAAFF
jgi:Flp pilus assembly protein TadG